MDDFKALLGEENLASWEDLVKEIDLDNNKLVDLNEFRSIFKKLMKKKGRKVSKSSIKK